MALNNKNKQPPIVDPDRNEAAILLRKGIIRRVIIVLAIIVVFVLLQQCLVITMPNEYKVIRQFGEIKSITTSSGVSLKVPFIQDTFSVVDIA